jgi:hypothetical protein
MTAKNRFSLTLPSIAIAAFLVCSVPVSSAKTPARSWKNECVGYYTLQVPGELEYALKPQPFFRNLNAGFDKAMTIMNVGFRIKTDKPITVDGITDTVSLLQSLSTNEFEELKEVANKELQKKKEEHIQRAEETGVPYLKEIHLREASEIKFHQNYNGKTAFAAVIQQEKSFGNGTEPLFTPALNFYVQVIQMTINATRKLNGTPQQTIDKFLSHFRSRAAFEVPTTPGVCLPYAFMSGEAEPADTGTAMRLKDHPDILIYLKDVEDYSKAYIPSKPVPSAKIFVEARARTSFNFGDAVDPLDGTLRPTRSVKIDGREGAGAFVKITRKPAAGADAINNEATKNEDWGYLAYIPADKKAPAGTSSDLIFRVERFNRFAKRPMTEKEFRQLVMTLAAGIKRRPGAFLAK